MSGLPDNSDAECEFQTTSALARRGTFALGGTPESDAMVAFHQASPVRQGTDGRFYSWFGIGQAALALPFYWAGRVVGELAPEIEERHAATTHYGFPRSEYFAHLFVGWRNPLLSALTALILTRIALGFGVSNRTAWIAGISYGLTTYAWAQARSTLSDVQATFFLFAAFGLLLRERARYASGLRPVPAELVLFGLALGGAFLTRVACAPAVLVLFVGSAYSGWRGRGPLHGRARPIVDALWKGVPLAICLALFLWANYARFGSVRETGYGAPLEGGSFFSYPFHLGLAGLLFAPGKGLLWLAPGVLLAPLGVWLVHRSGERFYALLLAGVLAAAFVPTSLLETWHGAWTYGPRYILPALPFLWVAVAVALQHVGVHRLGRIAAAALLVFGLTVNVPAALVDHMTHQDLAVVAARVEWGDDVEIEDDYLRDASLFQNIQWDFGFAAPWAHWRIFFHRAAGRGDVFSSREIFFTEKDVPLETNFERERGFRHLAWVDLAQRLDGPVWPGVLLTLLFLTGGVWLTRRGAPGTGS